MVIIILEGKSSLKYLNWLWVEFLFFCGGSGGVGGCYVPVSAGPVFFLVLFLVCRYIGYCWCVFPPEAHYAEL